MEAKVITWWGPKSHFPLLGHKKGIRRHGYISSQYYNSPEKRVRNTLIFWGMP